MVLDVLKFLSDHIDSIRRGREDFFCPVKWESVETGLCPKKVST